jgi:23S rRNA pseudouridine1911/1915/1917 synthase
MKYTAPHEIPVIEALAALSPDSSKTTLKKWVTEGRLLLNGTPLRSLTGTIAKGSTLELGKRVQFVEDGVKIYYEDGDLVVVEKPAGLLSVSTAFEKGDTLHGILKRHFRPRQVQVVHRLDQDTSGVMAFTFSDRATAGMKDLFAEHAIDREYTAIVEGNVLPKKGTWSCYLYEDAFYRVHAVDESAPGKLAITHYEVIGVSKRYTKLRLKLETGRKNQIRVHCEQAGHPIVGDAKYGAKSNPIRRMALHASLLGFVHPVTKKKLHFTSPVPEEFERLVC